MRNPTNSRGQSVNRIAGVAAIAAVVALGSHFMLDTATGAQVQEGEPKVSFSQAYSQGLELMRQGQPDSAIVSFEQALASKPNHTRALVNLTRAHLALEQFDEAQTTVDKAIASDSTSTAAFLVQGRVKQCTGENDDAITAYEKSIELNEHNPYARNNIGLVYLLAGEYADAVAALEKAIEQKDDVAFFFNNLGMAYEGTQELEKARESFESALEIDPDYGKAQTNLDRVEAVLGITGTEETEIDKETDDDFTAGGAQWDDDNAGSSFGNGTESDEMAALQEESFSPTPAAVVQQQTSRRQPIAVRSVRDQPVDGRLWLKGVGALALIIILAVVLILRNSRETMHRTA